MAVSGCILRTARLWPSLALAGLLLTGGSAPVFAQAQPSGDDPQAQTTPAPAPLLPAQTGEGALMTLADEIRATAYRLPLAAMLGAVLALRPRRQGTPARQMSVVETQIILAVVGALVMLVVGASLARAFGIVGAANLIRYRAKVDDPKDAVVMLSSLGVGLASGVGLYGLAIGGTLFIGVLLWTIESFEPAVHKHFELTVGVKEDAQELRGQIESILGRYEAKYELRASAADEVSYLVTTPANLRTDRVSNEITRLAPPDEVSVEWASRKGKDL
jgi:uncharacterized membrane protein YhiD involved in acid resistance